MSSEKDKKTVGVYKIIYDSQGKVTYYACEACNGKKKGDKNRHTNVQKLMSHLKTDHGHGENTVSGLKNNVVARTTYELNDEKAISKKESHCDRKIGIVIDPSRGQKQGKEDSPCVYCTADAASFELVKNKITDILKGHDEVKEDLSGYRKVKVISAEGQQCEVEEIRVFFVDGKKVTTTFYYSTSAIQFQGGALAQDDIDGQTPSFRLATLIAKIVKNSTNDYDVKLMNEKIKNEIKIWKGQRHNVFEKSSNMGYTRQECKITNKISFSCNYCDEISSFSSVINSHIRDEHKGIVCLPNSNPDKSLIRYTQINDKLFKCNECGHTSTAKQGVSRHINSTHGKRLTSNNTTAIAENCPKLLPVTTVEEQNTPEVIIKDILDQQIDKVTAGETVDLTKVDEFLLSESEDDPLVDKEKSDLINQLETTISKLKTELTDSNKSYHDLKAQYDKLSSEAESRISENGKEIKKLKSDL